VDSHIFITDFTRTRRWTHSKLENSAHFIKPCFMNIHVITVLSYFSPQMVSSLTVCTLKCYVYFSYHAFFFICRRVCWRVQIIELVVTQYSPSSSSSSSAFFFLHSCLLWLGSETCFLFQHVDGPNLTHWGRGHLNCLNARSRGFF